MKSLLYIFTVLSVAFMSACTDNPLADIENSTDWQKERNITSILLEGQIGTAYIERNFDDAQIKVFAKTAIIEDISRVEVNGIELSYKASSPIAVGSVLDFSTDTTYIEVQSGAGEKLQWEVILMPFQSDIEGTWNIGAIAMYCDMFSSEEWGWETHVPHMEEYLPALNPELDDLITFEVEGADLSGNPYGSYMHDAGADGVYGEFIDVDKGWDFNYRFRNIPTGQGTWMRDFVRNKVVITDANNVEYEFDLELNAETGDVTLKYPLPYLSEELNWEDTDWQYEELAHMSNPMWYTLTNSSK